MFSSFYVLQNLWNCGKVLKNEKFVFTQKTFVKSIYGKKSFFFMSCLDFTEICKKSWEQTVEITEFYYHPLILLQKFRESTVRTVLEAAASILFRKAWLRLVFKWGLYLRAASITNLLKITWNCTQKCTFSSKIDHF